MIRRDTVIHNFLARSVELADDIVFRWPAEGEWKGATGTEIRRLTQETCAGLLAMGMAVGDRMGIVARNSPEWLVVDYAIQHAAGIVVPCRRGGFPATSYTPTLKLKRHSLHQALADEIERLYPPDP